MNTTLSAIPAAVLLAAATLPLSAASDRLQPDDYTNLLRVDLRATKAQIVAESLELTAKELEDFWPVYREYDTELGRINGERINLIREFANNFASFDDRKARDLTARTFDLAKRRLALLERSAAKVSRATSPLVAARFVQIETQLLMLVDIQLASDLPLIPRGAIGAEAPGG